MSFTRLVFQGDVEENVLQAVIAYATQLGLDVDTQASSREGAREFYIAPYIDQHYPRPMAASEQLSIISTPNRFGHTTAWDLMTSTLVSFVNKRRPHDQLVFETLVLRFMIDQGIRFRDADPAELFRTPLNSIDMDVRVRNQLQREGLWWLEQASLFTRADIDDIRNAGTKAANIIEALLKTRGLGYWPTT